jgi:hypothetical protein
MAIFEQAQIDLIFQACDIDGQCMSLHVIHDDGTEKLFDDLSPGQFQHNWTQRFPGQIQLRVDGKGPSDTKINDQGQIVRDKYIQLIDLRVDGLSIDPDWLFHHIHLERDNNQRITSSYWGFNGRVIIEFDSDNSWIWLARAKGQL